MKRNRSVVLWLVIALTMCWGAARLVRAAQGGAVYTVVNTADSGDGSLRAAINFANQNPNTVINFNIPGSKPFVIQPLTALPELTVPVTIDGSTQPGYSSGDNLAIPLTPDEKADPNYTPLKQPVIVINGVNIPMFDQLRGLSLAGGSSTVKSLIVVEFWDAIVFRLNGNNTVTGCVTSGNYMSGIYFYDGSNNSVAEGNLCGLNVNGNAVYQDSVRAGNGNAGIYIRSDLISVRNNVCGGNSSGIISYLYNHSAIKGNFVGLCADGKTAVPNTHAGIYGEMSLNLLVGGLNPGEGNVVSCNGAEGIKLYRSDDSKIQGNIVGQSEDGLTLLPNSWDGIALAGSSHSTISLNQIFSTGGSCISIYETSSNGVTLTPDSNSISSNQIGTTLKDSSGNSIRSTTGMYLRNATNSSIAGNTIGSSTDKGIGLYGACKTVFITGNTIGVSGGVKAERLQNEGVLISNSCSNINIGGPKITDGNCIAGSENWPCIKVTDNAAAVLIQNNRIGVTLEGQKLVAGWTDGNGYTSAIGKDGILIESSGKATIRDNVVAGARWAGIRANSSNHVIAGNMIGVGADGLTALGNKNEGINVGNSAKNVLIGGTGDGDRNIVGGAEYSSGIIMNSTSNITIQGNYIGVAADGITAIPNKTDGISVWNSNDCTIGGNATGAGNTIWNNGANGVYIYENSTNINVTGNSIVNNGISGIYSTYWADFNRLHVSTSGVITGNLFDLNRAFVPIRVDIYSNQASVNPGRVQGKTFLRSVTLRNSSYSEFAISMGRPVQPGEIISVTATRNGGNTSAFYQAVSDVTPAPLKATLLEAKYTGNGYSIRCSVDGGIPLQYYVISLVASDKDRPDFENNMRFIYNYFDMRPMGNGRLEFTFNVNTGLNLADYVAVKAIPASAYPYASCDISNVIQLKVTPLRITSVTTRSTSARIMIDGILFNQTCNVELKGPGDTDFGKITSEFDGVNTASIFGLSGDTTYQARVRTSSQLSNVFTFTTGPVAPTNLHPDYISTKKIMLAWQDNSAYESGFRIGRYEKDTAGNMINPKYFTVNPDIRSFTDTTMSVGKQYNYYVLAMSSNGDSDISNTISVTILNPIPALTSLAPATVPVGVASYTMLINGSGFVEESTAHWNAGTDIALATTFVSATQLKAIVPASLSAAVGTAQVTVVTPDYPDKVSNGVTATIASLPRISVTATAVRSGSDVTVTCTLINSGGSDATNLNISSAKIGTAAASTPLPAGLVVQGGKSLQVTLKFSGVSVTPGAKVLAVSGAYTGGSFSSSVRVTVP